jgi:hypothetical protein
VVTDYLIEENRVLNDQLEGQRLRFTDKQRQQKKSTLATQSGLEEWLSTESL